MCIWAPLRGAHTGPFGVRYQPPSGVGKWQLLFFVSHGQPSASRLVYQPQRGWYRTPKRGPVIKSEGILLRYEPPLRGVITRRLMRTRVWAAKFWPVWTSFRFNFAAGFWPKLWPLFSLKTPSGWPFGSRKQAKIVAKIVLSTSEMQEECCKSLILKQWYHYFSLIFLVLAYWENSAFLVWYN